MPFDISEIAFDPDLSECVTVIRSATKFIAGGISNTPTNIDTSGVITVATDEAILMVPEGDRVEGMLQLLCAEPLYETTAARGNRGQIQGGLSDRISWSGNVYDVIKVAPWKMHGIWIAILARTTGD